MHGIIQFCCFTLSRSPVFAELSPLKLEYLPYHSLRNLMSRVRQIVNASVGGSLLSVYAL